jgi:hypothetical protein
MMKRTMSLLLFGLVSSVGAMGQVNCSNGSPTATKLVCQIPFSTGVFNTNGGISPGSLAAAQGIASTINSAFATQVSQLPLASASAGTVVLYKAGIPVTYDNLGPILTDRATTIGRHKLFLSFSASQFYFTDIDGISLGKVPFTYQATATDKTTGAVLSNTYTTETADIHFKLNQYVAVATFGVTNRLDASMILPIERVSIGAATLDTQGYILNANNVVVLGPYAVPSTYVPGTASGIGDIVFNGKYVAWRGEHSTLSTGMDLRTPTGDDLNYLGSGAWGFNPYLVYSYLAKVSPHARIGYQWNTATELNNPTLTPGGNKALPGGVQFNAGVDWAWTKQLTVAGDLLTSQYSNAAKVVRSTTALPTPATNPPTPSTIFLPTVTTANSSYTIGDLSIGLKWNPYRDLVVSGNVLIQLNNEGLRTRPAPLLGVSYKF